MNTIASFVRTDPDRARELILEFADFTRYSFRAAGQYTTPAEELRDIDRPGAGPVRCLPDYPGGGFSGRPGVSALP